MAEQTISCRAFYGKSVSDSNYQFKTEESFNLIFPLCHSHKLNKLLGPSTTWKVFKKQNDCLAFVNDSSRSDLMPFTFQDKNDVRMFFATHPIVFWYYDSQRLVQDRHSYEIIRENVPSKLYFDLEFDWAFNHEHNGIEMIRCFVSLVCCALKVQYNLECNESHVLDLDSSSETKFSHHLIFQLGKAMFQNNYEVGYFVKTLCFEIRDLLISGTESYLLKNVPIFPNDMKQLFVTDSKGIKKLFVDEGVYTKNRHFRIYRSSKLYKNVPLVVSANNTFKVVEHISDDIDEEIFLYSLITYVPKNTDPNSIIYLSFDSVKLQNITTRIVSYKKPSKDVNVYTTTSPYSDIDDFIKRIISPGQIWRAVFFPNSNVITYDIINNRFCHNIGRSHKSNNIKYVVDVSSLTYYQKCYDPDCATYRSEKWKLPIDIRFLLNDSILFDANELQYSDNFTNIVVESENNPSNNNGKNNCNGLSSEDKNGTNFLDYGIISDIDLVNALENVT